MKTNKEIWDDYNTDIKKIDKKITIAIGVFIIGIIILSIGVIELMKYIND